VGVQKRALGGYKFALHPAPTPPSLCSQCVFITSGVGGFPLRPVMSVRVDSFAGLGRRKGWGMGSKFWSMASATNATQVSKEVRRPPYPCRASDLGSRYTRTNKSRTMSVDWRTCVSTRTPCRDVTHSLERSQVTQFCVDLIHQMTPFSDSLQSHFILPVCPAQ
jgi:hypothetical protein